MHSSLDKYQVKRLKSSIVKEKTNSKQIVQDLTASHTLCREQKNAIATYKSLQRSEAGAIQKAIKPLEVHPLMLFHMNSHLRRM